MGERLGADFLRERDLAGGGERAGHRGAEQVGAGVDGAGAERREDEVAHELFAQVFDDAVLGAGPFGFFREAVQLATALPHVGGEAEHASAVALAQPGNDRRRVETAGVGEYHERAGARGWRFMHMCA